MRLLMLIAAIGSAFANCLFTQSWLYIVSAVCGMIWFWMRYGEGPAVGERFVTLCGAGLTIGALWEFIERHRSAGAAELAFLVVIELLTFILTRYYVDGE